MGLIPRDYKKKKQGTIWGRWESAERQERMLIGEYDLSTFIHI
jgi:hypothetical protein